LSICLSFANIRDPTGDFSPDLAVQHGEDIYGNQIVAMAINVVACCHKTALVFIIEFWKDFVSSGQMRVAAWSELSSKGFVAYRMKSSGFYPK